MSVYHEKARELGNLILESDFYEQLVAAGELYESEKTAETKAAFSKAECDYNNFVGEIMDIVRLTVTGKTGCEKNCGGCGGECGK